MKENKKKLNNKGFSLVELIIVIAIMAILAGALAPQLIKYLDKSRKATDVQTAQTIATAVNAALADEKASKAVDVAFASAAATADQSLTTLYAGTDDFQKEVKNILGGTAPKPKYNGETTFFIDFESATDKSFRIYAGTVATDPDKQLYPTVGNDYN